MTGEQVALLLLVLAGLALSFAGRLTRRVRPNPWTGLRTPSTFADPRVWRDANERAGRELQRFGLGYSLLAAVLFALVAKQVTVWLALALLLGGLLVISVRAIIYAHRRREHYRRADPARR